MRETASYHPDVTPARSEQYWSLTNRLTAYEESRNALTEQIAVSEDPTALKDQLHTLRESTDKRMKYKVRTDADRIARLLSESDSPWVMSEKNAFILNVIYAKHKAKELKEPFLTDVSLTCRKYNKQENFHLGSANTIKVTIPNTEYPNAPHSFFTTLDHLRPSIKDAGESLDTVEKVQSFMKVLKQEEESVDDFIIRRGIEMLIMNKMLKEGNTYHITKTKGMIVRELAALWLKRKKTPTPHNTSVRIGYLIGDDYSRDYDQLQFSIGRGENESIIFTASPTDLFDPSDQRGELPGIVYASREKFDYVYQRTYTKTDHDHIR